MVILVNDFLEILEVNDVPHRHNGIRVNIYVYCPVVSVQIATLGRVSVLSMSSFEMNSCIYNGHYSPRYAAKEDTSSFLVILPSTYA